MSSAPLAADMSRMVIYVKPIALAPGLGLTVSVQSLLTRVPPGESFHLLRTSPFTDSLTPRANAMRATWSEHGGGVPAPESTSLSVLFDPLVYE